MDKSCARSLRDMGLVINVQGSDGNLLVDGGKIILVLSMDMRPYESVQTRNCAYPTSVLGVSDYDIHRLVPVHCTVLVPQSTSHVLQYNVLRISYVILVIVPGVCTPVLGVCHSTRVGSTEYV